MFYKKTFWLSPILDLSDLSCCARPRAALARPSSPSSLLRSRPWSCPLPDRPILLDVPPRGTLLCALLKLCSPRGSLLLSWVPHTLVCLTRFAGQHSGSSEAFGSGVLGRRCCCCAPDSPPPLLLSLPFVPLLFQTKPTVDFSRSLLLWPRQS